MGSAISALASLATTSGASTQAVNQQTAAKDLAQLILDISAGDTTAAQKDLTTLTKDLGTSAASGTSDANSPLGKLLTALTKDLGSNDIGAAQKDVESFLSTLESAAATAKAANHTVADTTSLSSTSSTSSSGSSSSDLTSLSNYLATLLLNLQANGVSPVATSASAGTA